MCRVRKVEPGLSIRFNPNRGIGQRGDRKRKQTAPQFKSEPFFISEDSQPGMEEQVIRRFFENLRSCLVKVQTHLASVILSMAMRTLFSAVAVRISTSLLKRRKPPSQAKVRYTAQRFGRTANPSTIRSAIRSLRPPRSFP
jgi:hypothetical protein